GLGGVCTSSAAQRVDEALDDEAVLRGAHRTPEPERNAELLVHVLDAEVRDVVWHIADGSHGGSVDRIGLFHPLLDENAGADDTGEPRGGSAAGVKGGAKDIVRRGA